MNHYSSVGALDRKRYTLSAPRFIYVKKFGSFARKTSRLNVEDSPRVGVASNTRYDPKKIGAGNYPYTKPMKGFDRVFVGYGPYRGKGRHKKGKNNSAFKSFKVKHQGWAPYISTYGSIQAGMKYGSAYRNKKV